MEFPSYGSLINSTAAFYKTRWQRVLLHALAQLLSVLAVAASAIPWALLVALTWGNWLSFGLAVLGFMLSIFALAPLLSVFPLRVLATDESFGEALQSAQRRYGSTFSTLSWNGFFVLGGIFCFFVPGLVLFIWFVFFGIEMAIGDQSGKAALSKSRAMMRGNFWQAFFWMLLLGVSMFVASAIVALLPGGGLLSWLLINPVVAVGQLVLYDALKDAPESEGMQGGEWAFAWVVAVIGSLFILVLLAIGAYFAIEKMPEMLDKFQQSGGFPKLFDAIKVVPKS